MSGVGAGRAVWPARRRDRQSLHDGGVVVGGEDDHRQHTAGRDREDGESEGGPRGVANQQDPADQPGRGDQCHEQDRGAALEGAGGGGGLRDEEQAEPDADDDLG